MTQYKLDRDNGRDVEFSGELLASTNSYISNGETQNRWTALYLYRSDGGKLICHEVGRTQWQGEHDRSTVHIAETEDELINKVGIGWLAKKLYEEAKIKCVETID